MQWRMLQQEKPEDFVIATGVQRSVRDFVDAAAAELGLRLRWEGHGADETGIVADAGSYAGLKPGQVIVRVDPRYFRPLEVDNMFGDAAKARAKLGWQPKTAFEQLVKEMVHADLESAAKEGAMHQQGLRDHDGLPYLYQE
jgi:GDPmannose 4,6-dehydratase